MIAGNRAYKEHHERFRASGAKGIEIIEYQASEAGKAGESPTAEK